MYYTMSYFVSNSDPGQRRWIPRLLGVALLVSLAVVAAGCGDEDSASSDDAAITAESASPSDDTDQMASGEMDAEQTDADQMGDDMAMMMETVASESWDGMRVELAATAPTTFTLFQGGDNTQVQPTEGDSVHLMAVLADEQSGERIPYADVWITLRDSEDAIVFDERLWPMLSRAMGTHYGINVPLPEPASYTVDLQVGAPQGARHPEYSDRWMEPTTFTMTYTWNG